MAVNAIWLNAVILCGPECYMTRNAVMIYCREWTYCILVVNAIWLNAVILYSSECYMTMQLSYMAQNAIWHWIQIWYMAMNAVILKGSECNMTECSYPLCQWMLHELMQSSYNYECNMTVNAVMIYGFECYMTECTYPLWQWMLYDSEISYNIL